MLRTIAPLLCAALIVEGETVTRGGLYVRSDSDQTTVWTPRVHLQQALPKTATQLEITYSLDAWTSASVDIRTAATPVVREVRHEGVLGLARTTGEKLRWSVGYRLSHEPDYLANSVGVTAETDFLRRTITLAMRVFGSLDRIGRADDATFRQLQRSGGAQVSAAFVLGRTTLLQLAYELRGALGYMASPYRFVAVGPETTGVCDEMAAFCLPETHPRRRSRHAGVLRLRQALGRHVALALAYRYYYDSWQLQSHTGLAELLWTPRRRLQLALELRAYSQSGAFFYRAFYRQPTADARYFTRDRELSALGSQRLGLRTMYTHKFSKLSLDVGALAAVTHIGYAQFVGLRRVWAGELSTVLGLQF